MCCFLFVVLLFVMWFKWKCGCKLHIFSLYMYKFHEHEHFSALIWWKVAFNFLCAIRKKENTGKNERIFLLLFAPDSSVCERFWWCEALEQCATRYYVGWKYLWVCVLCMVCALVCLGFWFELCVHGNWCACVSVAWSVRALSVTKVTYIIYKITWWWVHTLTQHGFYSTTLMYELK